MGFLINSFLKEKITPGVNEIYLTVTGSSTLNTYVTTDGFETVYYDWGDGSDILVSAGTVAHDYAAGGPYNAKIYSPDVDFYTCKFQSNTNITSASAYTENIVIAYHLFSGCSSLKNAELYSSMDKCRILEGAFYDCTSLTGVTMPTSMSNKILTLHTIFYNCNSLTGSITIPSNATGIISLNSAFYGSINLKRVDLPPALDSCVTLLNTFRGCKMLTGVTMPTSMSSPTLNMNGTFYNCTGLTEGAIIPSNATGITNLDSTYTNCYSIKRVDLPSNMDKCTTFSNALNTCTSLTGLTMPTSMAIGGNLYSAFRNCPLLTGNITIPSNCTGITTISNAFRAMNSLTSVTLPPNMDLCSDWTGAFYISNSLTGITMPTSLAADNILFNQTFEPCSNLIGNITIPENANILSLYRMCTSAPKITSVVLPSNMNKCTTMATAFYGCVGLTGITMPTSMSAITDMSYAFYNCPKLTGSLIIPSNATAITTLNSAFYGDKLLTTITLPTTLPNCSALTSAFYSCTGATINNLEYAGWTGTSIDATTMLYNTTSNPNYSLRASLSKLGIAGTSTQQNTVTSVRLLNTGSTFSNATAPQFDMRYCNFDRAAIVQLFNDLPTVTGKTLYCYGCIGTSSLTADDKKIAEDKGWTVNTTTT